MVGWVVFGFGFGLCLLQRSRKQATPCSQRCAPPCQCANQPTNQPHDAAQPAATPLTGAAAALRALAPHLSGTQLPPALDFLLSRGLTDRAGAIREGMVAAGVAVVDAHGHGGAETMLPLFESYLDKQVGWCCWLLWVAGSSIVFVRGGYARWRDGAEARLTSEYSTTACGARSPIHHPLCCA